MAGDFIRAIQPLARLTRRSGLVRGIGGFGGLFEAGPFFPKRPILVASADGVGTKLRLAQRVGWYQPLGVDLVAMNVNDLVCTGAEPMHPRHCLVDATRREVLFVEADEPSLRKIDAFR